MRVLFMVAVTRKGLGGHYHTLSAIAKSLAEAGDEVGIISFGYRKSPVLESLLPDIKVWHVPISNPLFSFPLLKLLRLIRQFKPQAIHAFDVHAFLPARIAAILLGVVVVLTKCGGPRPKHYFPRGDVLTVFSGSDHRHFTGRWKNVELIPNRVEAFATESNLVVAIAKRIPDQYDLKLIRITRIGRYYKKTLYDSVKLLDELRARGVNACLIVVGAVYEQAIYKEFLDKGHPHVYLFTEFEFTRDAKRVLPVADVAIGTGRSLMEAAVAGLPVLAPVNNLDIPVLVSGSNILQFLDENFSERSELDLPREMAIESICALQSWHQRESAVEETKKIADEFFLIDKKLGKYISIYSGNNSSYYIFDIFKNYISYKYRLTKAYIRQRIG